MTTSQQETDDSLHIEENQGQWQENEQLPEQETRASIDENTDQHKTERKRGNGETRSNFVHGLAVGLGIGCIATFVIMWVSVFFTPQLPSTVTYEAMLSVFIYPLIYLLAVGLVALTAGIVREYYSLKRDTEN